MLKQKKLRSLAAYLVLVLLASGLATGYAAPDTPGTARELTLDEAVKLALTNNPTGKIAVFDFEAAKGALTAARSARWFSISASHKDAQSWAGGSANIVDQYTNSVSLNWTLWSGNKVESQVSQAKLALDSSQWGIAKARQQLKYDATDAYFKFMAARDNVKLNQESVERLERYLQDVKLQFEVGVVA